MPLDEDGKPRPIVLRQDANILTNWATIVVVIVAAAVLYAKFTRVETIATMNHERLKDIPAKVPPPELLLRIQHLEEEVQRLEREIKKK